MNATGLLKDAFRHAEWADSVTWSAVLASPALAADETIRGRLHHVHLVQRAFLHVWRGEPLAFEGTEKMSSPDLARWGRTYHADVPGFLASLDDAALDGTVRLPWAEQVGAVMDRPFVDPTLGETVLQVAAHSSHHRGQVLSRIRDLGVQPPMTDFIAWAWSGKPAPSWPGGTA